MFTASEKKMESAEKGTFSCPSSKRNTNMMQLDSHLNLLRPPKSWHMCHNKKFWGLYLVILGSASGDADLYLVIDLILLEPGLQVCDIMFMNG